MSTSSYLLNGKRFGWGPGEISINPDKARLLKNYAIGKCLDVGFGSGIYSNFLQEMGHQVVGVDNQKDFVRFASKKYPNISFVLSAAEKLPFKDKEFDTIIAFDILEHLDDKKVVEEIFRVADRLIFSVPHTNQKILLRYGLSHAHYLDQTHLRTYTIKTARKLFSSKFLKNIFLKKSLPLSISGLLIERLSNGKPLKKLLLKLLLKPFLPEPAIYSTIFGVIEKR